MSPSPTLKPLYLLAAVVALLLGSSSISAQPVWQPLESGTNADLHDLHFLDDDLGYVVGNAGTVLRTTDGGVTWTDASPETAGDLYGTYFWNSDEGIVVGSEGQVWRTEDGGASWTEVASGTAHSLFSVSFSGDVGIIGADRMTILRSADGGQTWSVAEGGDMSAGFPYYGAHMLNETDGFVGGKNAIFQPIVGRTQDGGAGWDYAVFYLNGNEGELRDIHFVDEQQGAAVAVLWDGTGAFTRTVDGGQTWATTVLAPRLYAVDVSADGSGLVAGSDGAVMSTEDGGMSWNEEESGVAVDLRGLAVPSATIAYAVGLGGTVVKRAVTSTAGSEAPGQAGVHLFQSYPNPSSGTTTIAYALAEAGEVSLRVYDTLGREVAVLARGLQAPGRHEVELDAADLPAGVYHYVLDVAGERIARDMVVLR